MKRTLSFILAIAMVVTMCTGFAVNTSAAVVPEDVKTAMDAIIAYLDIPSVTVDDDLQTALDTYVADPTEVNLNALVAVWDGWTYGGQDAECVFFTDYFTGLINAFPKKEDGSAYIEAGAAKRTPRQLIQQHMCAVDSSLYVDSYGPADLYGTGADNDIKVVGRNAMNTATTASAAWAAWQNVLTIINRDTKLANYAALEATIAEVEALADTGDAALYADLTAVLAEAKTLIATTPVSGISQYRPAGQATSFT